MSPSEKTLQGHPSTPRFPQTVTEVITLLRTRTLLGQGRLDHTVFDVQTAEERQEIRLLRIR